MKGCRHCGALHNTLPRNAVLAVGFGTVTVSRDDETVWSGDDPSVTMFRFERQAKADPDHDWRVSFYAPLYDAEYQRQDGEWVLVAKGQGFA
jgi:hypothetical protein